MRSLIRDVLNAAISSYRQEKVRLSDWLIKNQDLEGTYRYECVRLLQATYELKIAILEALYQ